jgi:predicted outer membrane protein
MKMRLLVMAACFTTLAACSGSRGNTPESSRELQAQGAAQAQAQDSRSEDPLPESDPALVQKTIVLNELHHINQREIALAEIAKSKASTAAAERVADAVIATHEKLDSGVEDVARRAGVELGAYQAATHEQAVMDSLRDLNGKDFDRAFLASMKMSHESAAADLRRAKQYTKDPLLSRVINDTLPELEKHKRQSRRAEERVRAL